MKGRERIKCILILAMVLVLLAGCLGSYLGARTVRKPQYEAMVRAASAMEACMAELKTERFRRGVPIDEDTDRFSTGLIGTEFTAITTTLGNLEAKRTSCQPDMAALVCDLLVRAGVKAGDRVGVCATGSFPALNLAAVCAAEAMGAQPVIIVSVGASTYGANLPAFTAPEMLFHLYGAGLISAKPAAVTLGGDDDLGLNMGAAFFPDEAEALQEALDRMEKAGITVTRIPDRAENLRWREALYGDVACFISVGGHNMAMGEHDEGYALGQGLIEKKVTDGEGYLMGHYLARGVPCIGLLNVKQLCADHGMAFDPIALEKIGEGGLYYEKAYPRGPLILALLLSGALLFACWRMGVRRPASQTIIAAERRNDMNQARVQQFLTRYETAASPRDKALAIYNAMVAGVPANHYRDFLGADADAFLTFIKALQNEDSDAGATLAYPQDAPAEDYLAALYEKLKPLG